MKNVWVHREMGAPAPIVWELLTNLDRWPEWGPSVKSAVLHTDQLETGATGSVTTWFGIELPFEVTAYESGSSWAWAISGLEATAHTVEPLGSDRCRVGFGVPWPAGPYLAVCWAALQRIDTMATREARES